MNYKRHSSHLSQEIINVLGELQAVAKQYDLKFVFVTISQYHKEQIKPKRSYINQWNKKQTIEIKPKVGSSKKKIRKVDKPLGRLTKNPPRITNTRNDKRDITS